jgi:hypothetical protein
LILVVEQDTLAEWSKAPDSSSGGRQSAWVRTPLVSEFFLFGVHGRRVVVGPFCVPRVVGCVCPLLVMPVFLCVCISVCPPAGLSVLASQSPRRGPRQRPRRAPGGPPEGGVLGAEPLEPKRHSRLPSPPTGSSVAWAESGLAPSVPSPGSAMEQLFPGGSEPVPHGRGAPAAGALRSSWRPRAMGEPAGKSVRTDRTDLAWAWPY